MGIRCRNHSNCVARAGDACPDGYIIDEATSVNGFIAIQCATPPAQVPVAPTAANPVTATEKIAPLSAEEQDRQAKAAFEEWKKTQPAAAGAAKQ
ncbi:MAG: hypothetical protein QM765_47375 [Myxococcales bacterium]